MSRAKERGKGRTAYYNASLHQKVLSKATIAQKLNSALANNEMFLNFQPIISVQNGDIHGDWDGKILDVEKYRNVTFEPYDLRWIETC